MIVLINYVDKLREEVSRLKEENQRLKTKWGWRRVKSADQLEDLEPGTYGFIDEHGENYYGIKDAAGEIFVSWFGPHGNGRRIHLLTSRFFEVMKPVKYRKIHGRGTPDSVIKQREEESKEALRILETLSDSFTVHGPPGHHYAEFTATLSFEEIVRRVKELGREDNTDV